jgi:predicted amidohydrolase
MRLRDLLIVVLCSFLTLLPQSSEASTPQDQNFLLVGATLIDGTGAPPIANGWIHVRGDRIEAVGQGVPPEVAGIEILTLEGKTVIPGLADSHVHLGSLANARWMLKLALAYGITTVMDAANGLGNLAAIRRWVETENPVPHLYVCNVPLQGSYTEQRFRQKGGETQMLVEDYAAFGVDFLKVYNWLSSGALAQVVELGKKHGIRVTGHTPLSMSSVASIDAGIEILQHVRMRPYEVLDDVEIIARYPVDGALMKRTAFWAHIDPNGATLNRTLDAWEKRKDQFFITPTLVVQAAVSESYDYPDPKLTENPDLRLLSPALLESWKRASPPKHWGDLNPEEIQEAKDSVQGMATFMKLAHARGIRIIAGTDTPVPWLVPGVSLHQELCAFVDDVGMSPVEAIYAATGRAAEAFRVEDRGVIREGNVADLVILNGNLATDIRISTRIEKVILGGEIHERKVLLAEAAKWAAKDLPEDDKKKLKKVRCGLDKFFLSI